MADFNIFEHLGRQGGAFGGQSKQSAASDGTNEKSTVDSLVDGAGKTTYTAAKLLNLPVNVTEFGQHGLQKAFGGDTEGITGKMVMPGVLQNLGGGFLAKLLYDIFIKNREITDHTGGGGSASGGDFASGTGSGGGDFSGSNALQMPDFSDFATPTNSFDWSPVALASLGGLPRPPLPDMGPSVGADMGIA